MNEIADLETTAATWVVRLDRGDLSRAERRELDEWLRADSRHMGAFVRAQAIWLDSDRIAAFDAARSDTPAPERKRPVVRMLAAASAAFVLLLGGLFALYGAVTYLTGREVTERGEIRRITLADGSAIVLNTSSLVHVRFEERERRVVLQRGEATFQVARDEKRPFVVEARGVSVKAVGTAFSVRIQPQGVSVTVTEGMVEVVRPSPAAKKEEVRVLSRNRQLVAVDQQPLVAAPVSEQEIERRLSWQEGLLVFDGERLADAVSEVNRYSPLPVVIDDAQLGAKSFIGVFRVGDSRAFADAAAAAFGVPMIERDGALHLGE